MKRLLLLMIVFFGGIVQVVAENTLFYDFQTINLRSDYFHLPG